MASGQYKILNALFVGAACLARTKTARRDAGTSGCHSSTSGITWSTGCAITVLNRGTPNSNRAQLLRSELQEHLSVCKTAAVLEEIAVNGMMECGGMMWGMGIIGLLTIVALALLIAALVKYLFFSRLKQ